MSDSIQPSAKGPAHTYERDQVVQIIRSVIGKVEHNDGATAIYQELKNLQAIIEEARKEIGLNRPSEITDTHIPTASDELDAVVEATAEATGTIMDSCEAIEKIVETLDGGVGASISTEVTKIFEACSFQDITGQRITKVITTLKTIETKVAAILAIMGSKLPGIEESASPGDQRTGDAALLNGPQMPDKAISQDDIDRLLSEFD